MDWTATATTGLAIKIKGAGRYTYRCNNPIVNGESKFGTPVGEITVPHAGVYNVTRHGTFETVAVEVPAKPEPKPKPKAETPAEKPAPTKKKRISKK